MAGVPMTRWRWTSVLEVLAQALQRAELGDAHGQLGLGFFHTHLRVLVGQHAFRFFLGLADLRFDHLAPFLAPYSGQRLIPTPVDVRDGEAMLAIMRESDAVMSAIPYYFNFPLAKLAVDAGVHFTDLGGNTAIVEEQRTLNDRAVSQGVTVVPDVGLAPGMVNILAQMGIDALDTTSSVRIYVGGLPQNPEPPLNYQVVYSLEGVLDYYTTMSQIVRGGRLQEVEALSEVEPVEFDSPVGTLEAFHTAGGLSTMGQRYEGKIDTLEYKTLRFPGHAAIMHAIRELGLFEQEPVEIDGLKVSPRDVTIAAMGPRLRKSAPDMVVLRVEVSGEKDGREQTHTWELVDRSDEERGISAMMRTTGFTLSIIGQMQARGDITPPGVHTPDEVVPGEKYVAQLARRGIEIRKR